VKLKGITDEGLQRIAQLGEWENFPRPKTLYPASTSLDNLYVSSFLLEEAVQDVVEGRGSHSGNFNENPPEVRDDNGTYYLLDGYHRLVGAIIAEELEGDFPVKVVEAGSIERSDIYETWAIGEPGMVLLIDSVDPLKFIKEVGGVSING
jgi:hypothetical protein